MDPYEQLDLPPSTRQLPTGEQRELLTERYLQLLGRTDEADRRLQLQQAWQYGMERAGQTDVDANRGMGEWVEAGYRLVEPINETEEHRAAKARAIEGQSTGGSELQRQAIVRPDDGSGCFLPCPFGHGHAYDDERGGRVLLRCPSCRALFSAIVNAQARDVRSVQALSAREREWAVTIIDPETSEDTVELLFRGATTIDMAVSDRFSLVSSAGARGDHPLWLINHTRSSRWALSGRGSGVGFFQRTAPAPVSKETVALVGYVFPIAAVWALAALTMAWWMAGVVAIGFAMFVWRPFVVPALLPIGEQSPVVRAQRRIRRRR